jgi:pimeloyl-ACP methyl ester carboxylesterase
VAAKKGLSDMGPAKRSRCDVRRSFVATVLVVLGLAVLMVRPMAGDDSERSVAVDHYVRTKSTVAAMSGETAQIYVRERANAGTVMRGASLATRVVLFVHGAGTPAEVSFDVPYQDYSWMGYLAAAGYDTFAMDTTGYGRSTRPAPMNDPCNLSPAQQASFVPMLLAAPCAASYPHQLTTIASDWDDINTVVDYIRALRHVERVSLVAWSLGGPRAAGYAAQHPDKVQKLVLLAPAYNRGAQAAAPAKLPADGFPMNTQSHTEFTANWDRQVGCPGQYEPVVSDTVWSEMLASDSVGRTWGTGVRRAPATTTWGWNAAMVAKTETPTLMVAGAHDKQVPPERVKQLYEDLGTRQKVFIDLACSSHNAMWEKNHLLLFRASLEWLRDTTVNGKSEGMLRAGYTE